VNQVQGLLQDVLRRRTTRLAAGPGRPLAELLSEILVGLTLVAVAIPWFLESRSFVLHLLLSGMLVMSYIALITLSVELLYPFAGQVALGPEPFQAVLR
jgi:CHASE2 domain-containing sensor protein